MDDAGRVNPYEHLAFPGTGLLRLVVGERLGAIAGAQTNRLHAPLPNKHLSAERERDKPRQGVVANTLNLFRKGAVGFIDWLGVFIDADFNGYLVVCATIERLRAMLLDNLVELDRTSNRVKRCEGWIVR